MKHKSKDKATEKLLQSTECDEKDNTALVGSSSNEVPPEDSFCYKAAAYFYDKVRGRLPNFIKEPFLEYLPSWADTIEKLIHTDGHTEEEIRLVFRYLREVDDFWGMQIRVIPKLRKRDKQGTMYFDLMLHFARNPSAKMDRREVKSAKMRQIGKDEPSWM